MTENPELRACTQCNKILPIDEYYVCGGKIKSHCRSCHKWYVYKWMDENPAKLKAIKKKYYDRKTGADDIEVSEIDDSERDQQRGQPVRRRRQASTPKKSRPGLTTLNQLPADLLNYFNSMWRTLSGL